MVQYTPSRNLFCNRDRDVQLSEKLLAELRDAPVLFAPLIMNLDSPSCEDAEPSQLSNLTSTTCPLAVSTTARSLINETHRNCYLHRSFVKMHTAIPRLGGSEGLERPLALKVLEIIKCAYVTANRTYVDERNAFKE
jgi:hypothetical protein